MFRNKEFLLFTLILLLISATGFISTYFFAVDYLVAVIIFITLFLSVTIIFTIWRYKELAKLSHYLKEISNGNYSLDIRDNFEGELSILKNEMYKVTRMLSEQGAMLEEDKKELTNGISDISHQLKTPLTSMQVMTELLSDPQLPEEKRVEFTENIRRQLIRIDWLVTSLLKLSKIDAGTVRFKKEKILVKDIIDKAIEAVAIPIDIKELDLRVNGDKDISIIGDLNWTSEAFINLLKNAVEHTDEKGSISFSWYDNSFFTEIILEDSGSGISKKDLPYIFQRFYRGENANDESIGIGLAMAQSIVTSQLGSVDVFSEKDKGTTFKVKFYHDR